MERSVAEGISTSLQTCPPHDPQDLSSLGNLPSPPSYDNMHVNDLGLTPPPGSQLRQSTDATHPHPRIEEHSLFDRDAGGSKANCPSGRGRNVQPGGSQKNLIGDRFSLSQGKSSARLPSPAVTSNAAQASSPKSWTLDDADIDDLFFDPVFDASFSFPDFGASRASRKRTFDEALTEESQFSHRPEKKQMVHVSQNTSATPPAETPSLSSPDTSVQVDQVETAPNTPSDIEALQPLDPTLDFLDSLFSNPALQTPPDDTWLEDFLAARPIPLSTNEDSSYDASRRHSLSSCELGGNGEEQGINSTTQTLEPTSVQASTNELTKQKFSLGNQHVLANTGREVLQHVDTQPQYTSPYPHHGGSLGYLPSAPVIHVKCITVADDKMNARLAHLTAKVQHLKYERDKYKDAWNKWTTRDPGTGKTREQILEGQNATLRRVSTQQKRRVELYKQEIEALKTKLHDLGALHNTLLYEINVQKRLPAVAPIPPGYKPPHLTQNAQAQFIAPGPVAPPVSALHQSNIPGPATPQHHVPAANQQSGLPGLPAFHPPAHQSQHSMPAFNQPIPGATPSQQRGPTQNRQLNSGFPALSAPHPPVHQNQHSMMAPAVPALHQLIPSSTSSQQCAPTQNRQLSSGFPALSAPHPPVYQNQHSMMAPAIPVLNHPISSSTLPQPHAPTQNQQLNSGFPALSAPHPPIRQNQHSMTAFNQPIPGATPSQQRGPTQNRQSTSGFPALSAPHPPAPPMQQLSATTPGPTGFTPAASQKEIVTIDLTQDEPEMTPDAHSAIPSRPLQEGGQLLQTLRKKKYDWLEKAKSGSAEFAAVRAGSRTNRPPAPTPMAPHRTPSVRPSLPPPATQPVSGAANEDQIDPDDELLRELEEELARG